MELGCSRHAPEHFGWTVRLDQKATALHRVGGYDSLRADTKAPDAKDFCRQFHLHLSETFFLSLYDEPPDETMFSDDDVQAFGEPEAFTRLAAEGSSATKARCVQLRRVVPH